MSLRGFASLAFLLTLAAGSAVHSNAAPQRSWKPPDPPKTAVAPAKPAGAEPSRPVRSYDGIPDVGQFLPDTTLLARVEDRVTRVRDYIEAYFNSYAEHRPRPDSAGRIEFLNSMIHKDVLALVAIAAGRPLGFEDRAILRTHTDRVLSNVLFQRAVIESVTVTEDEIKSVYEQYRFRQRMRHILFGERAAAEKVRRDLVAGRVSWKDAVRRHSRAADRDRDGELGWSQRVDFDPVLAAQVYSLEPGEISPVIRTSDGYHLFQSMERQATDPPAFVAIRPMIRGQIREVKVARRKEALQSIMRDEIGMTHDSTNVAWAAGQFSAAFSTTSDPRGATLHINAEIPEIAPADTARVLARHRDGRLTLGDFLASYTGITPLLRPNVNDYESMRSQVDAFVLEPHMATLARRRGLERDSLAIRMIESRREEMLVEYLYRDSILSKVRPRPADLRAFYDRNLASFHTYPRVRFAAIAQAGRAAADSVAARLRAGTKAEELIREDSLAGRATGSIQERAQNEEGAPYHKLLFEDLRPGKVAVEGPDREGVYAVLQLLSFNPGRQLSFAESEHYVEESVRNLQAEALLKAFLERHRKRFRIEAHPERLPFVRLVDPTLFE